MDRKAPWDDLTTPVYVAVNTKQRKTFTIVYAWFCVAVLVAGAIFSRFHVVCALLAVLLALAILLKKQDAVTERGLESCTDLRLYASNDIWAWDDIEYLTYENNPAVPDVTLLFFTKGVRTRKAFFKNDDAEQIKRMAKARKITVYDGNEYRAEARAYNASQKRKGKKRKKK